MANEYFSKPIYRYSAGQRVTRNSDGCVGTLTGTAHAIQHAPCYNIVFDAGQVSRTGEWLTGTYPDLGQEAIIAEANIVPLESDGGK